MQFTDKWAKNIKVQIKLEGVSILDIVIVKMITSSWVSDLTDDDKVMICIHNWFTLTKFHPEIRSVSKLIKNFHPRCVTGYCCWQLLLCIFRNTIKHQWNLEQCWFSCWFLSSWFYLLNSVIRPILFEENPLW